MEALWHKILPVCGLVCEKLRIIAVEIIYDLIIHRRIKLRNGKHTVIIDTAYQNISILAILTDRLHGAFCQCIPFQRHARIHDLIQQLKCHPVAVFCVFCSQLVP